MTIKSAATSLFASSTEAKKAEVMGGAEPSRVGRAVPSEIEFEPSTNAQKVSQFSRHVMLPAAADRPATPPPARTVPTEGLLAASSGASAFATSADGCAERSAAAEEAMPTPPPPPPIRAGGGLRSEEGKPPPLAPSIAAKRSHIHGPAAAVGSEAKKCRTAFPPT